MVEKCVCFGFSHAHQSTSATFRFFKTPKRVDVVNVRGKSVKEENVLHCFQSMLTAMLVASLFCEFPGNAMEIGTYLQELHGVHC